MSNNRQSSVEWFAEQTLNAFITNGKYDELLQQAKAMHKKEIKDAIYWGNLKGYDEHKRTWVFDEDEQYYEQTFNTEEK
jgi:homospermidine synthase